jgi:hypothetical protein
LSLSEAEVRRLDGERLHPSKGSDGGWRYAVEEVVGLLRHLLRAEGRDHHGVPGVVSTDGETAAAAFARFEKGEGAARIVIDLKLNPRLAIDLRTTFDEMTGALALDAKTRREIEGIFGSRITSGAQLVKCLAQAVSRSVAPTHASSTLVDDEMDFGTVVDVTTGQVRPLTKEESQRAATSLAERNARPSKDGE